MPITLQCQNCGDDYKNQPCKRSTSKFCSKKCKWEYNHWSNEPNTECTYCKKSFHMKPSAKNRFSRNHGYFCSNVCYAKFKSTGVYDGNKNPNYRGKTKCSDGYPLRKYVPTLLKINGMKRMKLHHAVCCEILGVNQIPLGYDVHHRDCDVYNNDPNNLVLLDKSDHIWIHKQFGNATLWAHYHNKVTTRKIVSWSDDKDRASRILGLTVIDQRTSNFKSFEDTHRGDGGFGSTG